MHRRLAALIAACLLISAVAGPAAAIDPRGGESRADKVRVLPVGASPAVAVVPPGTVGIVSSAGYSSGADILVIAEIMNNTTGRREGIEVTAAAYDADDNFLGEMTSAAFVEQVGYGATSPVVMTGTFSPAPAGYSIDMTNSGTAVTARPLGAVTITRTSTPIVGDTQTFNGDVFNHSTYGVEVFVAVTTYDTAGFVIDADWPLTGVAMSPNSQGSFSIELYYDPSDAPARAQLVAQGRPQDAPESYVTSWNNYFDDLGTSSFRKDIVWLAEHGITKGCGAGLYCPNANVRRDEMASFLARALNLTASQPDAFIDDVGNAHEPNINRIAAAGITAGCNPAAHLYCPSANVRRDEMASFLSRARGLTGIPPDAFTDDNGNTHELNINRVALAGITTGCGGTKYCPTMLVTRAQMAAFLRRAFE